MECARRIQLSSAHSQKIGILDNLKVFVSKKNKGHKEDGEHRLLLPMAEGDEA